MAYSMNLAYSLRRNGVTPYVYHSLACAAADATVHGVRRALALFGTVISCAAATECLSKGTMPVA